jgi:uncharacterized protein YkwD
LGEGSPSYRTGRFVVSAFRRFSAGLAASLLLVALLPAPSASAVCYSNSQKEKDFARKMNSARDNNSRGGMILDPELSKAAKKHTMEMVNRDTLYHTPSDALRHRVTHWSTLGENVGVGSTVSSLHEAFMNSPAHRDNILFSSFRYVGVGTKTKNGRLWVTVIFEATSNPGSPLC